MNSILIASAIVCGYPHWVNAPPIYEALHSSACVRDVESRLPANHPYRDSDLVTWVHECTHGINSLLRQKHNKPCFYLLGGKALICSGTSVTLAQIARRVPISLRGETYTLYLISAQKWWNAQPTYILDELSAYLNGATCRKELKLKGRHETIEYAYEIAAYCFVMLQTCGINEGDASEAVREMVYRLTLIESPIHDRTMIRLRTNNDCRLLRVYLCGIFGPHWTREHLGF